MNKVILMGIFSVCLSMVSLAGEPVFLYLTGDDQGVIEGETGYASHEKSIECAAYSHMVAAEPDPDSGITGKVRNHYPVTILKAIDKAAPRLFRAWKMHERLEAEFRFFRPDPSGDGTIQHFYTVLLHDAYIAGIRQMVYNTYKPEAIHLPAMERISFTYGEIEVIFPPTETTGGDKWHADTSKIPLSDVNFDGIVNMQDFVILADDWMMQY